MTPERYQQVTALLDAALELPTADRAAFIGRACDGDEELRREVESLLASCPGDLKCAFADTILLREIPYRLCSGGFFLEVRLIGRVKFRNVIDLLRLELQLRDVDGLLR